MQGVNGLYGDSQSEKEAFSKLDHLKKKETVTDYDMELASYMESKYRKEDKIIKISNLKYIDVR